MARPTKLTPEVADKIVWMIEHGMRPTRACLAVGVGVSTFEEWMARGEARDPDRPMEPIYAEFAERVREAEPKFEAAIVELGLSKIKTMADVVLFLERRFPENWRRRDEVDVNLRTHIIETATAAGLDADEVMREVEAVLSGR